MQVHANAMINPRQRPILFHSSESYSQLARFYGVSKATIHRWKHREDAKEGSCRPHTIHYALSSEEEAFVLGLRSHGLPLDEVVETAEAVIPHVRRSSVHRLFVRCRVNRPPKKETGEEEKPGTFKTYAPGFLHIDLFYLPKLDGTARYCFVAVDRATRLVFLGVYEHKNAESATDFLKKCLTFFPFKITKILTDNGREFTLEGFRNRYGPAKKAHPFDQLCQVNEIEHRRTKPYTPKTNGLAERTNGLIKEGTTKQERYASAEAMIQSLHDWNVRYNFYRKHRRIGKITPYQAVCHWYEKRPDLFIKEPSHLLAYCSQSYET
jgi:transposase InsO family protein